MQTYVVMSALDCVAWALQSLTALRGALCPRPRVHTLGPPSVTSDIRERERERNENAGDAGEDDPSQTQPST